ncbi:isochorismatase family protein [Streptomyces sp. MUM 178J]|uniref:isochorismatase family protein n=1 Tax=Streptomyces sp. MUM 178J TaxID=2791991 RepID=UPI001F0388A8|nr:isochorismatase family protein [Streptomyces sp. MUM 178J]WRQ83090.1 isochorismatase family protein [Streptomyces sp. MUM 178J]
MSLKLRVVPYELPTRRDMPVGVVDWTVRPERAVLLVHDMQNYFLAAFAPEMRARLVDNAAALRRRCADRAVRVAYTAQPGRMTAEDRGLLQDFWGAGMTSSDADRAIAAELAPDAADWTFTKWRYSAFFRTDLLARMRAEGRDQLVVCGVYGHVGILTTALDAYSNDVQVFLAGDAIGDFSADKHRQTLQHTASCCARVATAEELVP